MNLAARGLRDMDTGRQKIADRAEFAQVRAQARKVHVQSAALVIALTVVALLVSI